MRHELLPEAEKETRACRGPAGCVVERCTDQSRRRGPPPGSGNDAPSRPVALAGRGGSSLGLLLALALTGCATLSQDDAPIAGARPADDLIEPGEVHFARLWQVTAGGENAEGYWSFAGDRLVLQRTNAAEGVPCDRIFVTGGARACA